MPHIGSVVFRSAIGKDEGMLRCRTDGAPRCANPSNRSAAAKQSAARTRVRHSMGRSWFTHAISGHAARQATSWYRMMHRSTEQPACTG